MASPNASDVTIDLPLSNSPHKNDSASHQVASLSSNGLLASADMAIEAKVVDPGLIEAQSRLHALLDSIDGNKRKREDESLNKTHKHLHGKNSIDDSSVDSPLDWTKQLDPATGVPYYYNHRTHVSQWEKPNAYVDSFVATSASGYSARATFAKANGSFSASGDNSYWDQVET